MDYLLRIGEGTEANVTTTANGENIEDNLIEINNKMLSKSEKLDDFIDEVYPNISNVIEDTNNIIERTILAAKNEDVDVINDKVLYKLNGDDFVYYSADSIIASSTEDFNSNCQNIPVGFLNSLNFSGIPPHKLIIKKGAIVMLMRNLNPSLGLCNGTRLICQSFSPHLIQAEIITGVHRNQTVLIPRISLIPSDVQLPFEIKRRQFPIRPAFAMTINKAQGQTMKFVWLYLPHTVSSHGQLYVALSRVSSTSRISIFVQGEKYKLETKTLTKNVVYK